MKTAGLKPAWYQNHAPQSMNQTAPDISEITPMVPR